MSRRLAGNAKCRGANIIEFTFVAIPLMFVLISVFEISRGMWLYNTLSHGVREGVRYAVVHGNNCAAPPNKCTVSPAAICNKIKNAGPGLESSRMVNIELKTITRTLNYSTLSACQAVNDDFAQAFPSKPWNSTGSDQGGHQGNPVEITVRYRFDSALAMFWPGSRGITFGRIYLAASAKERVKY